MDQLVQADIFFFITSIAVILVALGVIVALVYAIKVLHNLKVITDRLAKDTVSAMLAGILAESTTKLLGSFFKEAKTTKKRS